MTDAVTLAPACAPATGAWSSRTGRAPGTSDHGGDVVGVLYLQHVRTCYGTSTCSCTSPRPFSVPATTLHSSQSVRCMLDASLNSRSCSAFVRTLPLEVRVPTQKKARSRTQLELCVCPRNKFPFPRRLIGISFTVHGPRTIIIWSYGTTQYTGRGHVGSRILASYLVRTSSVSVACVFAMMN
jgi:hypothetical protein